MVIKAIIKIHPIIAAAQWENMEQAVASKTSAVFFDVRPAGDLMEKRFSQYNRQKPVFIHTDLVKGLAGDDEGKLAPREEIFLKAQPENIIYI
ncbi:hypothetical protein SDC9_166287 [bioreactor metagenome]|uniref:Uncharacterized protein n=1 Tax=bioreactor metagenome TaxID=1076179 RepID=A0A645FYY2_9ZZZZ|nr:hypothetical protein [Syntrophomonadaceae bacterium]